MEQLGDLSEHTSDEDPMEQLRKAEIRNRITNEVREIVNLSKVKTCPCCLFRFKKPLLDTTNDLASIVDGKKETQINMIDKYH